MTAATTNAISVTEYAAVVARKVRAIPGAVIEGEVQKPKTTQSGMLCFDLTDGETKFACKVFRGQRGGLDHDPEHGELVQVSVERPRLLARRRQARSDRDRHFPGRRG